jgi:hypothetical protein
MGNSVSKRLGDIALPAVLFLALLMRLIAIGSHQLWYDEAFAVLFSERIQERCHGTLPRRWNNRRHPSARLLLALLAGWKYLKFANRCPLSVIFGIGIVWMPMV